MRIQVLVPDPILPDIDRRAKEMGVSRSAYFMNAVNFKIQYDDMMELIPKMSEMIDQAKASGLISIEEGKKK